MHDAVVLAYYSKTSKGDVKSMADHGSVCDLVDHAFSHSLDLIDFFMKQCILKHMHVARLR